MGMPDTLDEQIDTHVDMVRDYQRSWDSVVKWKFKGSHPDMEEIEADDAAAACLNNLRNAEAELKELRCLRKDRKPLEAKFHNASRNKQTWARKVEGNVKKKEECEKELQAAKDRLAEAQNALEEVDRTLFGQRMQLAAAEREFDSYQTEVQAKEAAEAAKAASTEAAAAAMPPAGAADPAGGGLLAEELQRAAGVVGTFCATAGTTLPPQVAASLQEVLQRLVAAGAAAHSAPQLPREEQLLRDVKRAREQGLQPPAVAVPPAPVPSSMPAATAAQSVSTQQLGAMVEQCSQAGAAGPPAAVQESMPPPPPVPVRVQAPTVAALAPEGVRGAKRHPSRSRSAGKESAAGSVTGSVAASVAGSAAGRGSSRRPAAAKAKKQQP